MKARIVVTLKAGVLDPQGKAIEGALASLGIAGIESVRQGKVFDIELSAETVEAARETLRGALREAPRQHRHRELRRRGRGVRSAARLAWPVWRLPCSLRRPEAATIELSREDLSLRYDDQIWKERASVGPLPRSCSIAAHPIAEGGCRFSSISMRGRSSAPGAGRFTPGAIGPAGLLDLRAQSIVPGARARPAAPLEPSRDRRRSRLSGPLRDRGSGSRDTRNPILLALPARGGLVLAALASGADRDRNPISPRFEAVAATIRKAPGGPP